MSVTFVSSPRTPFSHLPLSKKFLLRVLSLAYNILALRTGISIPRLGNGRLRTLRYFVDVCLVVRKVQSRASRSGSAPKIEIHVDPTVLSWATPCEIPWGDFTSVIPFLASRRASCCPSAGPHPAPSPATLAVVTQALFQRQRQKHSPCCLKRHELRLFADKAPSSSRGLPSPGGLNHDVSPPRVASEKAEHIQIITQPRSLD